MQLEHYLKTASDYELRGKYLHAAQIYRSIILDGEESSMPYIKLAGIYEKLNNPASGIKLLYEYLENTPDQSDVRLYLAQMLIKAERLEEAVDALSVISPHERPITSFISGYAYYNMKDYEVAKINFMNFIKLSKNSDLLFEAHLYLAKIHIELSDFNKALEHAESSEKLFGVNWELHLVYSVIYFYKKMYSHASSHIEKAIRLNKDNPELYEWAGKSALKNGDYVKAENYFLHFISISQASSETYSYLGLACLNNKKPKDAINYFEMALTLDPQNEVALDGKNKALRKV